MGGRSGQIAIVLILGGALLIYGGATGRLGAAWAGLTGGGGSSTPPPATGEPEPADPDEPMPNITAPESHSVATVHSVANNGQVTSRVGGWNP